MATSDVEGTAIRDLAKIMGYEVELNKPFMDVLSQLLQYHKIEVGSEFWSNIDTFTQGLIDREKPSRWADY